jgi:hypothetical protein
MRRTIVLALLLALPHAALTLPRESPPGGGRLGRHPDGPRPRSAERDGGTFDWHALHLEPLLSFVTQPPPAEDPEK